MLSVCAPLTLAAAARFSVCSPLILPSHVHQVDGKFVGVEDDTLLFDESGAWYDGSDLYDPREWEGEGGAGGVGREPYAAADRAAETKED